jgi:hypothetical protein
VFGVIECRSFIAGRNGILSGLLNRLNDVNIFFVIWKTRSLTGTKRSRGDATC